MVKIPYSQIKDIKKYNQKIEDAEDVVDRTLYQAAKEYSKRIPYEKAEDVLKKVKKKYICLLIRKNKKNSAIKLEEVISII